VIVCCLLIPRLLINEHGIFISIIFRNVIIEDSEHWYSMYNIMLLSF